MSGAVEIYLCKTGQSLKQGRVEYSGAIRDRGDAEADAVARCRRDRTLAKITYYAVNENGDFRVIFTYANPDVLGAGEGDKTEQKNKPKKKPKKRTLIEKLIDGLGVGDKKPPARTKAKPAKKKGKK